MAKTWRNSLAVCLSVSVAVTLVPAVSNAAEPMVLTLAPRTRVGSDASLGKAPAKHATFLSIGPRYGIGGNSPLGEEQKENFQLYDVAALFRLPWGLEMSSEWELGSRLIISAGELTAAGTSSLMTTIVPCVALTSFGRSLIIDLGLGGGFFTNYRFGVQDFGGPAQIVGTVGIGFDLFTGFHAGYRFQHFSDAGIYGPTSLGVDMHIMDLSYRF
jgi:Lipid A 3-O-deacylase (PagL)